MFNDISKPAPPLPETTFNEISPEISLLNPLTRRGHGPGLIVLLPAGHELSAIKEGVPSVAIKWAEEGYTVVGISGFAGDASRTLKKALDAFDDHEKCEPKGNVGLLCTYQRYTVPKCIDRLTVPEQHTTPPSGRKPPQL